MIPGWILGIGAFFKRVPAEVWIGLAAFAIVGGVVIWHGNRQFDAGAASVQSKWDAAIAAANAATLERKDERAKVTVVTETKYIDRVQVVRGKTVEVIKNVPIYVRDDACPVAGGFRLLHDASVHQRALPDPADIADAAPVPVATAAGTVVGNYGGCHGSAERLRALQEWVREQAAVR